MRNLPKAIEKGALSDSVPDRPVATFFHSEGRAEMSRGELGDW